MEKILTEAALGAGPIVVLTGAGISAESGIPTFRGPEGYWRVGSRAYHPQELATREAFGRLPREVWGWYLYRRGVCRAAAPNAAHRALARLEAALGERFLLVTQNVDGLHLRAGNSLPRTFQIHGNIDFRRCARERCDGVWPIPETLGAWPKEQPIGEREEEALRCPGCGGPGRPHVLWFDESYDERLYRWDSSIRAAREAAALVVVGTSGATNLPVRMAELVAGRDGALVVLNPEEGPFSALAARSSRGVFVPGPAGTLVPRAVEAILGAR